MSGACAADCERVKAYFASYRAADRGVALRLHELSNLKALAERVDTAMEPEVTPALLCRIQEIEAQTADEVGRLCVLRQEIESTISQVENGTLREILHRHYVQLQTYDEIAEALHYSGRHVRRLHQKALKDVLECPVHSML